MQIRFRIRCILRILKSAIKLAENTILNNIHTEFVLEMDTPEEARIIFNSIKPEIDFEQNERSKTDIRLDSNEIFINIESRDVVSLRASINSYVRWINLSLKILKI